MSAGAFVVYGPKIHHGGHLLDSSMLKNVVLKGDIRPGARLSLTARYKDTKSYGVREAQFSVSGPLKVVEARPL